MSRLDSCYCMWKVSRHAGVTGGGALGNRSARSNSPGGHTGFGVLTITQLIHCTFAPICDVGSRKRNIKSVSTGASVDGGSESV